MDDMPKHSKRMTTATGCAAPPCGSSRPVSPPSRRSSRTRISTISAALTAASGTPARLLPLSVDMLILVGELMLLHQADIKGRRFILGWVLVWSGILATLAATSPSARSTAWQAR